MKREVILVRLDLRIGLEACEQTAKPLAQLALCCGKFFHFGRIAQISAVNIDRGCFGAGFCDFGQDRALIFSSALRDFHEVGDEVRAALKLRLDIGPFGLGILFSCGNRVDPARSKAGCCNGDGCWTQKACEFHESLPKNDTVLSIWDSEGDLQVAGCPDKWVQLARPSPLPFTFVQASSSDRVPFKGTKTGR